MVAAVGPTASSGAKIVVSATAGLEAQIVRYQKQLVDCVSCDSAKTSEGKIAIQAIADKISAAKARIEEINIAKSPARSAQTNKQADSEVESETTKLAVINQVDAKATVSASASGNTVGSRIDVVA